MYLLLKGVREPPKEWEIVSLVAWDSINKNSFHSLNKNKNKGIKGHLNPRGDRKKELEINKKIKYKEGEC